MKEKFYNYNKISTFTDSKEWDIITIQIMRVGKWRHQKYGVFTVEPETLKEVLHNFKENVRGIDIVVDENHERKHIALWWIRELYLENNDTELYAKIELTVLWARKLSEWQYKYFSPEIIRNLNHDETGEEIKNLLIGGAFTNRPYFKGMKALQYSEDDSGSDENITFYLFTEQKMDKLLELLQKLLSAETMEQPELDTMEAMYSEMKGAEDPKASEMYKGIMDKKQVIADAKAKADAEEQAKKDAEAKALEDAKKDPNAQVQFTDPTTWETKAMCFAEIKAMETTIANYKFAEKKIAVSEKLKSFVFSETNKMATILPKHNDKLTNFAMSLDDAQFSQFSEILNAMTTEAGKLFTEEGAGGEGDDDTQTRSQKVDAKAQSIMKEKGCNYKEAVLEANKMIEDDA